MARGDRAAGRLRAPRSRNAQACATAPRRASRVNASARDKTSASRSVEVRVAVGRAAGRRRCIASRRTSDVLVTGPSGSGKSTLFRAIAGIWPFGNGHRHGAARREGDDAAAAALSPDRHAGAAVSYPAEPGTFDAAQHRASCWSRSGCRRWRSGSTRTRTGTGCCRSASSSGSASRARSCMRRTILFLDEATASLDEPAEAALYRLLHERLPNATIVSIGHRSTLAAFHKRG